MNSERYADMQTLIQEEANTNMKELYAMLYFGMLYIDYIKETDPNLHSRARAFAAETHDLKGVEFTL